MTEHARLTAASNMNEELERMGMVAHEVRGLVNTAVFAFDSRKQGTVTINGRTGALRGRSLLNLRDFVDRTLAVVRREGEHEGRERIAVATFLDHLAPAAGFHAAYPGLQFVMEPVDSP